MHFFNKEICYCTQCSGNKTETPAIVKKFTALIAVPLIEFGSNSLIFAYITLPHDVRNPMKKKIPPIMIREGVGKKLVKGKKKIV
jgi:hypothetical protein